MNAYQELAQEIVGLKRRLDAQSGPQLAYSSLEDGSINEYDIDGQVTSIFGKQYDGTHGAITVAGPTPPTPSPPLVTPVPNGVLVRVDGTFAAGPMVVAPLDFSHFEVHASENSGLSGILFSTKRGEVGSARGGEVFIPVGPDVPVFVRVVTRTVAGKFSAASAVVGPVLAGKVSSGAVDIDFDAIGGNTIHRQVSPPSGDHKVGDLWLSLPEEIAHRWEGEPASWVEARDQGVVKALQDAFAAKEAADFAALVAAGKARLFAQASPPTGLGPEDVGDGWTDTDDGNKRYSWTGTEWELHLIGGGAIQPNSLVLSELAVVGSVTAALLDAIIVLASVIILGDPAGNHQRFDETGSRVYRVGPDGELVESGRSGYGPGDYSAGGGTPEGSFAWMIPDNGVASFQGLFVGSDPIIMGRPFTQWISASSGAGNGQPEIQGAKHYAGWAAGGLNGITNEVGIIEMAVEVSADRWYWVGFDVGYRRQETNEIALRIRDGGASTPTMASKEIMKRTVTDGQVGATNSAFRMGIWHPQESGVHRLGLTAATQAGGVTDVLNDPVLPAMFLIDMGPRSSIAASMNRMGGGVSPPPPPASPVQPRYADIPAGAWASSRWSDGAPHPSATGPVQGYTQYAPQNGNSRGHWTFALPPIAGTITRIDFYVISEHWHFDTGGTAIFNIAITGNPYVKPMPDWEIGGYPKGNEKTVTLPHDWWPFFHNNGANGFPRADGITVGSPKAGTNPMYYGRFSAQRAALRIWWTE